VLSTCDEAPARGMSGISDPPLLMGEFNILYWSAGEHVTHYLAEVPSQRALVLAFRGTANLNNNLNDADILHITPSKHLFDELPHGYLVHQGFQRQFHDLAFETGYPVQRTRPGLGQYPLLEYVQQQLNAHKGYELIITGHSLGGAVAYLAYLHFIQKDAFINTRIRNVYTYGQPISGNGALNDYVGTRMTNPTQILRVVGENDIVPHMTKSTLGSEEHHVRHAKNVLEVYLPNHMRRETPRVCPYRQRKDCSDQWACDDLSWTGHMFYGGFRMQADFCTISNSQVPQTLEGPLEK